VASLLKKDEKLLHLPRRGRWPLLLPECHIRQSCRWV